MRRSRSLSASTFWLGIAGALIAAVIVLFLKEVPMRSTFEMPEESGSDSATTSEGAAPAGI